MKEEGEREFRFAKQYQQGRAIARTAAASMVALALVTFVQALFTASGRPALSIGLLLVTSVLGYQLAVGNPWARWISIVFTSARGMVGIQWLERLEHSSTRMQVVVISVAYLAIAAVLLFGKSVELYCRAQAGRER